MRLFFHLQDDVVLRQGSDSFIFAPKLMPQWCPKSASTAASRVPPQKMRCHLRFCILEPLCVVFLCVISGFLVPVDKFAIVLSVDSRDIFRTSSYLPNGTISTRISQLRNVSLGWAMVEPISSQDEVNMPSPLTITLDRPESPFEINSRISRVFLDPLRMREKEKENGYVITILVPIPLTPLERCVLTLDELSKR